MLLKLQYTVLVIGHKGTNHCIVEWARQCRLPPSYKFLFFQALYWHSEEASRHHELKLELNFLGRINKN